MIDLERACLWFVYAAALQAQKRRENRRLCDSRQWCLDVALLRKNLAALGMTL